MQVCTGNGRWPAVALLLLSGLWLPAAASAQTESAPQAAARLDPLLLNVASFAAGAAVTAMAVPSTLVVGSMIGSLPPNLIAAAIPALLIAGVLPPLAVAGGEWLLQVWLGDRVGSFWWTWGSTTLVHVAALVVGMLLGVSAGNAVTLAALTASEALVLPLTATAALLITRPEVDSDDAN